MSRVERIGRATLYLGDAREIVPALCGIAAIVTDQPYGMKNNTDYRRFSGGQQAHARRKDGDGGAKYPPVYGDHEPFDPSWLLSYEQVILWGYNHIAPRLPAGGGLVWVKRKPEAFGTFLSDAELGWEKGKSGVYCFQSFPQGMAHDRHHPTQKPVDLMRWCVARTKGLVCDPYMGAGSTGMGCVLENRAFIGVEIVEDYFDIACRRIEGAQREAEAATQQGSMFDGEAA